jgi:hypothetical protein
MKRGGKFLVSTTVLAVAACGGDQSDLRVRSIPTPLAQGVRTVPFRIAEARGQLALGNVALALESFRKAWRDDPNSTDALAGMAACYDRMGRFDLSRRNYESALALAPADVELLGAFAQSLQLQGKLAEAQRVRVEIAQRIAAEAPRLATRVPSPVAAPQVAAFAPQLARTEASVPEALTASAPVVVQEAPAEVAIPRPILAAAAVDVAKTAYPARTDVSVPNIADARIVPDAPAPVSVVAQAAPGPSVTIKLPPARRVEAAILPAAAPTAQAPAMGSADMPPLQAYARPVPKPAVAEEEGPRLERLSLGEIGLVTAPGPMWRPTTVAMTERSTTVRWVPLREASATSSRVRVLNAARVNRLATRTRSWLVARGWSSMAIGDAPATRSRSVVVYPARERALAQTLANQFGFAMEERSDVKFVTMILGRDAARIDELRPQSA